MPSNIPGVTALQRHASNLFYSVSKCLQKAKVTAKELMIHWEHLFKLIPKSIS